MEKLPVRLLLAASVLLVLAGALWWLLAQWPCAALSWVGAIGCGAAAALHCSGGEKYASRLTRCRSLYIIYDIYRMLYIRTYRRNAMAPKNKFTRAEMTAAALGIVRADGAEHLTAKTLAAALGISTQPVFTCFGSMEGVHQAVRDAARQVYDDYIPAGLREEIPFFGLGMQYIHFAREEPMLYRLLFLAQTPSGGAFAALEHSQALARPSLERIYHLTAAEADRYFRDLWLVVHSLATLIVTGGCPYTDREIGQILTGFSLSICKSIKEVPGFAVGTFDRDAAFRALLGEKE